MTRILIVSSCTAQKRVSVDKPLTLADFLAGPSSVKQREIDLSDCLLPAEEMYAGQQHVRLMRGVQAARSSPLVVVDVWIISAGYGLVPGCKQIAPYEVTFAGETKKSIRERAVALRIPQQFRELLASTYDLCIVLLGNDYVEAIDPDQELLPSGPTLFLCSESASTRIRRQDNIHLVSLTRKEARDFGCGLVGLKGEVAGRILSRLAEGPATLSQLTQSKCRLMQLIERESLAAHARPIFISPDWMKQSMSRQLRYFIPDWDDLVDPHYDFETDTHSSGSGDWTNEVFAHELYRQPNYDGILVSRIVLEKSATKRRRIGQLGIHGYLRVPDYFPVMGDCGAFGYINEVAPPYSTEEVLDYYTHHGFNFGVSVDHLIVVATGEQRQSRYELTIANAEEFITEHRSRSLDWEPVGAVQGWDPASYAEAARQVAAMGYGYIALGGLVRSSTEEIIDVVERVRTCVPAKVKIHLFGLARLQAIRTFVRLGVNSVDSASALRRAWMDSRNNYLTEHGWYTAIRVPDSQGHAAGKAVAKGVVSASRLRILETSCLTGLRSFAVRPRRLTAHLVDTLAEYEALLGNSGVDRSEQIRRTLEARPWEQCDCPICREIGIDVVLFRGNNRNRRRGFHNTYVFYRLLDRLSHGEQLPWIEPLAPRQLNLV